MNDFINVKLFIGIMLFYFSTSLTPLWNFNLSTTNILNGNESESLLIHTSSYFDYTIKLFHTFSKSSEGISQNKNIIIFNKDNIEIIKNDVEFNDIHSFIRTTHNNVEYYFICPKGPNYPLMSKNLKNWEIIEIGTLNEDSNLLCYYHSSHNENILLFMFSNNENVYGFSVRTYEKKTFNFSSHILDFIFQDGNDNENMIIVHLKENIIYLELVTFSFIDINIKTDNNYNIIDTNPFSIVQCNFVGLNNSYLLYCLTYDKNNSNFSLGYSSSNITFSKVKTTSFNKYSNIPFEFKNNFKIQSIKLIKNTHFAQYIINVDEKDPISEINKEITYFGILDMSTNKILFNSNEKIKKFYPSNTITNEFIIVTESSVYKLCGTAKYEGNCITQCSDFLKLDPENYNTCTNDDSCNGLKYKPYNICISKCDTDIFYNDGKNCGLCKYFDPNKKYKIYGENNCTNTLTDNLYELYPLINIYKKCYSTCEKCNGKYSNFSHNCESCIEDYYLTDKNCTKECYSSYYKNESSRQCEKCHENCLTCSKGSENGNNYCLSCNIGKYLLNATGYGKNCVDECPNNTIIKDNYCNDIDEEEERKKREEEERKKREEEERKKKEEEEERKKKEEEERKKKEEEEERKKKEVSKSNEDNVLIWYIILIILIIFSIFIIIYLIYMCRPEKLDEKEENIIRELEQFNK